MNTRDLCSAFLLFSLFACSKPKGFEYREVRNFRIEAMGFERSTLAMDLVYFNPNNFGVQLRNVDCDIYIDKNYLGKYVLDTLMPIGRKSEFILPSKIALDMRNVFKNGLNALFSSEVLIEAKGTTRVGKSGIFINFPFNYSGKHKLGLF